MRYHYVYSSNLTGASLILTSTYRTTPVVPSQHYWHYYYYYYVGLHRDLRQHVPLNIEGLLAEYVH